MSHPPTEQRATLAGLVSAPGRPRAQTSPVKPRIVIVNAYFDPWRNATPTRLFVPRAMAPYFLAGHINPDVCDVRVWDEAFHGALLDRRVFASADIVILTGLTAALDRTRQLAACFRASNPRTITVIGGPIARAFPALCEDEFDYVCQGDTDTLAQAIADILAPDAAAPQGAPRFDMTSPKLGLGHVETTKYCNFACSFCALTGEGRPYSAYSEEAIEKQLDATGRVQAIMLLDNNFFGNNRRSFERRVEQLGRRVKAGQFRGWGCLVTGDFFANPDNLPFLAKNGCMGIFSGVESLSASLLKSYNKRHSTISNPLAMTTACAENGILFDYGMMVDFTQQTMADVASQIEAVLGDKRMRLPAFISATIPIVGTPYFDQSARLGRLMPNVLLSDLDGMKLVEWPLEPVDDVAAFFGALLTLRGRKRRLLRHVVSHAWHWRHTLSAEQLALAVFMPLHRYRRPFGLGSFEQMRMTWREQSPTFAAPTDARRQAYAPPFPMETKFSKAFEPMVVTDSKGRLSDAFERARERPIARSA